MPENRNNGNGEFRGSTKAKLEILADGQANIANKIEALHKEALSLIEAQRDRVTELETWRATLTARMTMLVGTICTLGTVLVNWVMSKIG